MANEAALSSYWQTDQAGNESSAFHLPAFLFISSDLRIAQSRQIPVNELKHPIQRSRDYWHHLDGAGIENFFQTNRMDSSGHSIAAFRGDSSL
jgi:hypothetical protein